MNMCGAVKTPSSRPWSMWYPMSQYIPRTATCSEIPAMTTGAMKRPGTPETRSW